MSCRFAAQWVVVAAAALSWSSSGDAAGASEPDGTDRPGVTDIQPRSRGTYLIVYAEHLADAAVEWAEYRAGDGWQVVQHPLAPSDDADAMRRDVRASIRRSAQQQRASNAGRFAVLLLGDADEQGIPTWRVAQTDASLRSSGERHYATDHPYQVLGDADARPDVALGRIPARTVQEARVVLAKVKRYEQDDRLGPWRRRIAYAAGEGHFGIADHLLEALFTRMVAELVPDAFDVSMTYAKASSIYCPPPSQLTDTVLRQLSGGALLFNYIGHGNASGFDRLHWGDKRLPILEVADLDRLTADHGRLPIAVLTCCSAGWYDLPDGRVSLAEAMLFHPAGPVAVIAGSRPTHPYANIILQKDITRLLLIERVETVGELDLLAMRSMVHIDQADRELDTLAAPIALASTWPSSLRDLRQMHVRLYNLLGDPVLRIAQPAKDIVEFAIAGERISGRIGGMRSGHVIITVETDRALPARPQDLLPILGTDDPELEIKAARNYPLANDRVLRRLAGEVVDGRFAIVLQDELPGQAMLIKAYAVGEDAAGEAIDAFAALRLPVRRAPGAHGR